MAGGIDFQSWLEAQLADTPSELAQRTRDFIARAETEGPAGLVIASELALDEAIGGARDRRAALDLLAADALVTLALAASVETDPGGLERFATWVRGRQRANRGAGTPERGR